MEKLVKNEKIYYFLLCCCFIIGYAFALFCGNLLQTAGGNLFGNNEVYRGQLIDKSEIARQNKQIETTTEGIRRANKDIRTTTEDIDELLRIQQQYLIEAKRGLEKAVRVDEEEK